MRSWLYKLKLSPVLKSLIGIFFFHLSLVFLNAQDPYYINYDTKDGLPSSEVYSVEVDSNGIIWFATDRGVSSYNGYEFKAYTTDDGLANNTILAIWKDRKGNYWLPGIDGSLSIYDHKKFYPYKWNDELKQLLKGRWVQKIVWDKKGKLYFWITGFGATRKFNISQENGKITETDFKTLKESHSVITGENINFIDLDGYYIPDDGNLGFIIEKLDSNYVYSDIRSKALSNEGFRKVSIISNYNNLIDEIEIGGIQNIYVDDLKNIWVCTKSGIFRFTNDHFPKKPEHYFNNISISDIKKDEQNNYWLTTLENGVILVPSFNFKVLKGDTKSFPTTKIMTTIPLKEHLILGDSKGGILSIDKYNHLKKVAFDNFKRQYLFGQNMDKKKAILRNSIIEEIDGQIEFVKYTINKNHFYLWELNSGKYLILYSIGFRVIDLPSKEILFDFYPRFSQKIISVCETQHKIWLGTISGLFSADNLTFDSIYPEYEKFPILKSRINDIKSDFYNNLWLSTIGEGLLYKTKDTVLQLTSIFGLNSNFINRTFVENDSTLWIASNNGLNKLVYTFENKIFSINNVESYNTTDGLLTNFINDITKWNDKIWLATNKGINYFSPSSLESFTLPPKIFLEKVTVNDSLFKINEALNLNYNQNDLYFKFTGISYRKQKDKPFYRYRLMSENADSTWYFTNNRDVRFNDLQAGKYTFEAAAQNKYGQWSEKPIIYDFTIHPRFTQTIWFRILTGLAILAIVVFFIRTRSNRIKIREEQKRKLQEAELKTKDAELQALRNQMNPHFVFNALNSIQNFVFKNDAKKANYYLSRFSKLMRDGLQFARLKYISLQEEIIFLNTYLELEKMRFPDKFQYRIIVDEAIPTSQYFIPPLLFQPILENAVKHAFKNIDYEGLLEIRFEEKIPGELLKITISDNGEGINLTSVNKLTKSKNKSLGLEIIKNQIALLNSEGKDNKATFKIFNRQTIDPQRNGTQAEFIISIKFSENDQGGHH
jgi:ligand-binding sensor domain-containing protein/signal transduction histidine kinase